MKPLKQAPRDLGGYCGTGSNVRDTPHSCLGFQSAAARDTYTDNEINNRNSGIAKKIKTKDTAISVAVHFGRVEEIDSGVEGFVEELEGLRQ